MEFDHERRRVVQASMRAGGNALIATDEMFNACLPAGCDPCSQPWPFPATTVDEFPASRSLAAGTFPAVKSGDGRSATAYPAGLECSDPGFPKAYDIPSACGEGYFPDALAARCNVDARAVAAASGFELAGGHAGAGSDISKNLIYPISSCLAATLLLNLVALKRLPHFLKQNGKLLFCMVRAA